jgi:hypothetical protein
VPSPIVPGTVLIWVQVLRARAARLEAVPFPIVLEALPSAIVLKAVLLWVLAVLLLALS